MITIKASDITEKKGHFGCIRGQINKIVSKMDKTGWIQNSYNSWTLPNGNYFSIECAAMHFSVRPYVNYHDKTPITE